MKVALLGSGKTGSKVLEILGKEFVTVFNTSNPPTIDEIKKHDVIISFLPGEAFLENIDLLIKTKIPVVTGSTGFSWPTNINERLKDENLTWIRAHNFSLGMNLVRKLIETMNKAEKLFEEVSYNIHEVHHTNKLDAPSGTALTWKKWLGRESTITHEREGDVIGFHELSLKTPFEDIKLIHNATDRKIFANGAIWAAKKVLTNTLNNGLHDFTDITLKEIL